jgi:hypothetical protein
MKPINKSVAVAFATVIGFALLLNAAGSSGTSLKAKSVWVYPFGTGQNGNFQDVTILEKTPTAIKFRFGDRVIEHCGHYTVEN